MIESPAEGTRRTVGIDAGAETIKVVVCEQAPGEPIKVVSRDLREHHKEPSKVLVEMLRRVEWDTVDAAAATGRLSRLLNLPRIPSKQAQVAAFRLQHPDLPTGTVVSIGSRGFSVLEIRDGDVQIFRENSRCSQGTGNFLRQLVERFDLRLEEAARMTETVDRAAPLSGRCPVILKTDMTHLANKGEHRASILAGLYDAVCENVQVLIKPKLAPPHVILVGGVARARRVREQFARYLETHQMTLCPTEMEDALYFEAMGAAALAISLKEPLPEREELLSPPVAMTLDRLPAPARSLPRVRRMPPAEMVKPNGKVRELVMGFDIGSTGSKALAVDRSTAELVWEGYLSTGGDPVRAARQLMERFVESPASQHRLRALGVTGSGREIVGSLFSVCYGHERVFILNEIAAHAEGAHHFDPAVDTIFEIGGQDAKYIRLTAGRVTDAAMNEACSAGTGSFIEEQGKRFQGIRDVVQLGQVALEADYSISLGQHCSVFMAEIIDEAVAAGAPQEAIIAGIYESIIQNYLNRVKGSRDVGQRIFCQGMPFSADALAAAVARQTGSEVIIPPNPGTVGALGIALLTRRLVTLGNAETIDPTQFLRSEVLTKDTFVCKSNKGCGGAGNKCRIDRLTTQVMGTEKRFLWGGSCSLYDRHTHKVKLPDLTPDPFRERETLMQDLLQRTSAPRGRPTIGLTDEFTLKSLFPFFATFLHGLGFDLVHQGGANQAVLKKGIEEANVPFCAPMQQYHGLITTLAERRPDYLFMPMIRSLPRTAKEKYAVLCPIVQASPDILTSDLGESIGSKILSPVIDVGQENLDSDLFRQSCASLAADLGVGSRGWQEAFALARQAQLDFDEKLLDLGRSALDYCEAKGVVPVIILGRSYTIYNTVLNSNVPALVREQGALPIPVDCYPIDHEVPTFGDLYWGYAQRSLRAAHQIRRTPGQYSIYCSNYSCGPDSFNLHFFAYAMEGRPFAIIETDGHSGDAGTKTRIEAFLHCVREDLAAGGTQRRPRSFRLVELEKDTLREVRRRDELVLVPRMGPGAEVLAAAFRGVGIRAEALPIPDADALELGRRHTSGKECVPMTITTGSLLQRLERDRHTDELFSFFMPTANGPCRFGVYNLLHKIILERLGWKDRVRVFSASDDDYFAEVPQGFQIIVWTGFMAMDLLLEGFYHTRPAETVPGAAKAIYERYSSRLAKLMERRAAADLTLKASLAEVATGRLFGFAKLLERAAREYSGICDHDAPLPDVLVVGEIYVRSDPFANGFVIDKLEERGVRARFAPFNEWIEYTDWVGHMRDKEGRPIENRSKVKAHITTWVQTHIQDRMYSIMAGPLHWHPRTTVHDSLRAAEGYLRAELTGEAVLTLGGPTFEHREGRIQGVVSVGPLECMPNKISETQFFHVAEREGLLSLTIPLNGEPFDIEVLEGFIFEVKDRFRKQRGAMPLPGQAPARSHHAPMRPRQAPLSPALPLAAGEAPSLAAGEAPSLAPGEAPSLAPGADHLNQLAASMARATESLARGLGQLGVSGALLDSLLPRVAAPGPRPPTPPSTTNSTER